MKKKSLVIFISAMFAGGAAFAQATSGEVRESTDPAVIAEVEQRAAEIIARQSQQQYQTSGERGTAAPAAASGESESTEPAGAQTEGESGMAPAPAGEASGASDSPTGTEAAPEAPGFAPGSEPTSGAPGAETGSSATPATGETSGTGATTYERDPGKRQY